MREQDEDGRSGRMIVLALESEPAQAATIRHVVCDLVGAELTLVKSVAHALEVLHTQKPDLILLPMFVAPAEEAELLAFIRALPNGAQIETQMTPMLGPRDTTVTRHGWSRWRARPSSINSTSAEEHHFAERLSWSLEQRREQRRADRCRLSYDTSADTPPNHAMFRLGDRLTDSADPPPLSPVESSPPLMDVDPVTDDTVALPLGKDTETNRVAPVGHGHIDGLHANRRAHRRFSGHELTSLHFARLRSASIQLGPLVSVVDVSTGGALVETDARLQPESEAVLELLGNLGSIVVPFRVLRWHVAPLDGPLRYRGACVFTQPVELADLLLPRPVVILDCAPLDCPEGLVTEIVTSDQSERRQHVRVAGPFDGCRRGVFDMPVLIHNLSESGCFIDSLHGVETGHQVTLGVQPPGEDWITVKAEVVRGWPGFGFAVRFVDMPHAVRTGLASLVARRAESVGGA
jgi:CheY-like chemotaxis protein